MGLLAAESDRNSFLRGIRLFDRANGAAFVGFALWGLLGTLAAAAFIALEVLTTPGMPAWKQRMLVVSMGLVAFHLILECRSRTGMGRVRWAVFAFAVVDLGITAWTSMNDPTSKVVFSIMALNGGLWLFFARLMLVQRRRLRTCPIAASAFLSLLAWWWFIALTGVVLFHLI